MIKKYIRPIEENLTTEPTRFLGCTTTYGIKGILIHTGSSILRIFLVEQTREVYSIPNSSAGFDSNNSYKDIEDFLKHPLRGCDLKLKDIYFAESLKELIAWSIE